MKFLRQIFFAVLIHISFNNAFAQAVSAPSQATPTGQIVVSLSMHKESKLSSHCLDLENINTWDSYSVCYSEGSLIFGTSSSKGGVKFDSAEYSGAIQKLSLPVGQYRVFRFAVYSGRARTNFFPRMQLQGFFEVQEGRSIYLGNWQAQATSNRTTWTGVSMAEGAFVVLTDQFTKDQALLATEDKATAALLENKSFNADKLRNPMVFASLAEVKPDLSDEAKNSAVNTSDPKAAQWISPKLANDPELFKQLIAENLARLNKSFGIVPVGADKMAGLEFPTDRSLVESTLSEKLAQFTGDTPVSPPVELLSDTTRRYWFESRNGWTESSYQSLQTAAYDKQEKGLTWLRTKGFYKEKPSSIAKDLSSGYKQIKIMGLVPYRALGSKGQVVSAMTQFEANGQFFSPAFSVIYTQLSEVWPYDPKTKSSPVAEYQQRRIKLDCRWQATAVPQPVLKTLVSSKLLHCSEYLAMNEQAGAAFALKEQTVYAWLDAYQILMPLRMRDMSDYKPPISTLSSVEIVISQ
jgi:hypothetical protein